MKDMIIIPIFQRRKLRLREGKPKPQSCQVEGGDSEPTSQPH